MVLTRSPDIDETTEKLTGTVKPPTPKPTMNLQKTRYSYLEQTAVRIPKTLIVAAVTVKIFLRPMTSASGDRISVPTAAPAKTTEMMVFS